jgi:hypothetical protein
MHTLKLVLLVGLTLTIMRGISWGLAWLLARWCSRRRSTVVLLSNAGGWLAFLGFLFLDRMPGEWLDFSAAIFGTVVYSVFAAIDWLWHPLRKSEAIAK